MVKYCEPFNGASEAFESAGMHQIIRSLGKCKLGKMFGVWYVIWG